MPNHSMTFKVHKPSTYDMNIQFGTTLQEYECVNFALCPGPSEEIVQMSSHWPSQESTTISETAKLA